VCGKPPVDRCAPPENVHAAVPPSKLASATPSPGGDSRVRVTGTSTAASTASGAFTVTVPVWWPGARPALFTETVSDAGAL